jgi:hypothetical protein
MERNMKSKSGKGHPDVSIGIVSDYVAGEEKIWNDLGRLFEALAKNRIMKDRRSSCFAKMPTLTKRFRKISLISFLNQDCPG